MKDKKKKIVKKTKKIKVTKDKSNIIDTEYQSKTINDALELVDKSTGTPDEWRTKGVGLQLVLLGLAEIQALRVSQLGGIVYKLERSIFKEVDLSKLSADKIIDLYEMATDALSASSTYVDKALKSVNWNELESSLLKVAAMNSEYNTESSKETTELAEDLLQQISKLADSTRNSE